jgi:hypothetical protein
MIVTAPPQEVKTTLANYKLYRTYMILLYLSGFFGITGYIASDHTRYRTHPSKIENHLMFHHFSKSKFVVENYETLKNIGAAIYIVSIVAGLLFIHFAQRCFNRGFFKISQLRVNINGDIFQWQELTALNFTINSPKTYGNRSAKQGFQNWIEFVVKGKEHRYEFYLETWTMEDNLLKILEGIKTEHIKAQIKIIETKKSWFTKLVEELGIDPQ